jgi:hypothetical protein
MGIHPVAVVILHITYTRTMKIVYSIFSWGELHGKHVVATYLLNPSYLPCITFQMHLVEAAFVDALQQAAHEHRLQIQSQLYTRSFSRFQIRDEKTQQ